MVDAYGGDAAKRLWWRPWSLACRRGVPKLPRMFLRCNRRLKDGKSHDYWSVVENRRLNDGRVVQRQVLYLGEINASQREAWRKTIEVHDEGTRRQVALFPAGSMPADDANAIGIRLDQLRLERPPQSGACWLSCVLELDAFWTTLLLLRRTVLKLQQAPRARRPQRAVARNSWPPRRSWRPGSRGERSPASRRPAGPQ